MNLKQVLERMMKENSSDLHLKAGMPPVFRIDGFLRPLNEPPLSPEELRQVALQLMPKDQQEVFASEKELDFAIGVAGLGRFRVNVYMQRSSVALALRSIPVSIKKVDELMLPQVIKDLSLRYRGLLLVTGTTGSGKSTTLAAMMEHINDTDSRNIITVEDPIEFLFRDKKSIISQREVGTDTKSFGAALRHVLRQDPDVILIGEIRDKTTLQTALQAADTGHMVFSTLHTLNASETINRIISFFPPHQHEHVRIQLASTLVGVVSLRLLPKADGKGRVPATEIMINTSTVKEYLLDPMKTLLIPQLIEEGSSQYGMQSFDQSILRHYKDGLITYETAMMSVTNPDDFKLRLRGVENSGESRGWDAFGSEGKK